MWVVNGTIPLWQYHRDRLLLGLQTLGISIDRERIKRHLTLVLAATHTAPGTPSGFKLMITRGNGARGYQPLTQHSPTLISQVFPLPANTLADRGAKIHLCQLRLPPMPYLSGIKSLGHIHYVLASRERSGTDRDEGLLLSTDNHLLEATARNIFLVRENRLLTPDLTAAGVPGVMRRFLIEQLACNIPVDVAQTALNLDDLAAADEVFLSNSITGIWPVVQCRLEDKKNLTWPVGPLTRNLQRGVYNHLHAASDTILTL